MERIPFPDDVNPSPDAQYSRNTRYAPHVKAWPPIWSVALMSLLVIVMALLSGCTGADAGEQPKPKHLVAQQEQRRAVAAAHLCGPGKAAVWNDSTEMQCMREVNP